MSNTCGSALAEMPMPLSLTATTTHSPTVFAVSEISPPSGVYLEEFSSRLQNTWTSRTPSPSTMSGPASRATVKR